MTLRRIFPYLALVILFTFIFWLTMIIPNEVLYVGIGSEWNEVITNNKLYLQQAIFIYGLTITVILINLLEIITTKDDRFYLRCLKSILTIAFAYVTSEFIYKGLDLEVLNMFSMRRPAGMYSLLTITFTVLGLIFLEFTSSTYQLFFDKDLINKYVPKWLKLELESHSDQK